MILFFLNPTMVSIFNPQFFQCTFKEISLYINNIQTGTVYTDIKGTGVLDNLDCFKLFIANFKHV